MTNKYMIEYLRIFFLFVLLLCPILIYVAFDTHNRQKRIDEFGINIFVKVDHYDRYRCGKSRRCTGSFGYFTVNYVPYRVFSDTIIPIGSLFEIRYNRKNPEEWRRIKRIVNSQ